MGAFELRTERLVLRPWEQADRPPYADMNADPAVMEFFPRMLTRDETEAQVDAFERELEARGYCPWAVAELATGEFIGFVGLHDVPSVLPFAPAVEVGWRLAERFWGKGYATEAARAALAYGFGEVGLTEVVSFTSVVNVRSRAVMERLGMLRDQSEDFDHPRVPAGSPLRPHVLYRLAAPA